MLSLMWMALRNKSNFNAKRARSTRGTLRVFGYVLVLALGFSAFSMHSARAEVAKTGMQLGRSLAPLAHMIQQHSKVDIDGESISMGLGTSPEDLNTVLDKFENHCRENGVVGTWDKAAMASAKVLPQAVPDMGVIRSSTKLEGVVLCFIKSEDTPDTLLGRLHEFSKTHDLSALGKLRYAYAAVDKGVTSITTMWTEDHFRIDRLMPTESFEPGSDNPLLPRPIQARRILSGTVEGTPYGVRGYLSTASPREVLDHMDTDMTAGGWQGLQHPEDAVGRAYMKDGVIVFAGAIEKDGKTMVSMAEMGGQQPVTLGVEAVKAISITEK
ncbi:hypothetical protein LZC95_39890 [Pendulispora brunnea]|uniref:Uncharacterized protein n=1 Tax=Pendulispora brunnea TaxID=2905690 RepID=A0ABZ2K1I7_9BACT